MGARTKRKPPSLSPEVGGVPVAARAGKISSILKITATPKDTFDTPSGIHILPATISGIIGIDKFRFLPILAPKATGPLPNIASTILKTIGTCPARKTPHRRGAIDTRLLIIGPFRIRFFVTPGIGSTIDSPGCLFPFRLRRQAHLPALLSTVQPR